jgi:hypothetical protein
VWNYTGDCRIWHFAVQQGTLAAFWVVMCVKKCEGGHNRQGVMGETGLLWFLDACRIVRRRVNGSKSQ